MAVNDALNGTGTDRYTFPETGVPVAATDVATKAYVDSVPGTFKIGGDVTSAAVAQIDIPIPTGFQNFDFWFANVFSSVYTSLALRFSWDGGATFPSGATQYYYIREDNTNAAGGGPSQQGGQAASHILQAANLGSGGARVSGKAWWAVPVAGESLHIFSEAAGYDSTNSVYRRNRTWGLSSTITGPPNFVRLMTGTGTMAAGVRWQLNGIR